MIKNSNKIARASIKSFIVFHEEIGPLRFEKWRKFLYSEKFKKWYSIWCISMLILSSIVFFLFGLYLIFISILCFFVK